MIDYDNEIEKRLKPQNFQEGADVVVEPLQTCKDYNRSILVSLPYDCMVEIFNNKTLELEIVARVCYDYNQTVESYSVCESSGFNIHYKDGKDYTITHGCCSYYNDSPYKEFQGFSVISCKQRLNGVCNPLIQQTSKDFSEYDEAGRIFVIANEGIVQRLVGDTPYIRDNNINFGQLEVQYK